MSNYRDAVGLMIINREKRVFLGYRAWSQNSPYHWQMPQGGIDDGETPEQSAWRELYEETVMTQENTKIIAVSQNWYTYDLPDKFHKTIDGERQKWFLMYFHGSNENINLHVQRKPEFIRFRWNRLKTAPYLVIPFKKNVYREVLKEFRQMITDFNPDEV